MNPVATRALAMAATAGGAAIAKRVAELGWQRSTGSPPPTAADANDDRGLRDLVVWTLVLTVAVGIARKLAETAARNLSGRD